MTAIHLVANYNVHDPSLGQIVIPSEDALNRQLPGRVLL